MRKMEMRMKADINVSEAIDNFLRKCTARNLSKNTVEMYKIRLRVFKSFLHDETTLITSVNVNSNGNASNNSASAANRVPV